MRRNKGSTTAQITTLARAALDAASGPVSDPFARLFLHPPYSFLLPIYRTRVADWPWFRELLVNIAGRTCFFDEQMLQAMNAGVNQVVVLGAGYDSRAIRFARPDVRFFELDHSATQAAKSARLGQAGLVSPAISVSMDFETDSLTEALGRAGFQAADRTFFLWEGVIEYLTESAVRSTLARLHQIAAPGSILALDSVYQRQTGRPAVLRAFGRFATIVAGERRRFHIDPERLGEYLMNEGWQLMNLLESDDVYEKYLNGFLSNPRFHHNYVAVAACE